MRSGVTDARKPIDFGQSPDNTTETPCPARALAMVGVYVLPQERDLARTQGHQPLGLGDDRCDWPRVFGAPGIGDDTKGAKSVATLLH